MKNIQLFVCVATPIVEDIVSAKPYAECCITFVKLLQQLLKITPTHKMQINFLVSLL